MDVQCRNEMEASLIIKGMKRQFSNYTIALLLFLTAGIQLFAQELPEILWDKTIGGNFADRIRGIYPSADGGWYLFGTSSSNTGFEKTAAPYTMFGNDLWVLKYNSNWEKIWDKVLGGTDEESLAQVTRSPDGGFILAATSRSNASGDKSEDARSQDKEDYWVVKLDADGNKVWDRTYGGADIDELNSIRRHPWGGYIISGTSYSGKSGDKTHDSFGKQDWWVLRIDEQGNILWDKVFGGERFDQNPGIFEMEDGFIISGISDSPPSGNKTAEVRGSYDAWLVKIDFDGNKIWDKAFGGNENEGGASIAIAQGGGYILSITSKSSISGDKTTPDVGAEDAWFVKVDSSFTFEWDKTLGTVNQDHLSARRAGSGGYILRGNHTVEEAQPGGGIINYGQRWMIHTDDALNIIWEFKFGGDENETGGTGWRMEPDTTMILIGSNSDSNISGDKTEDSRGGPDFWLTMIQMPFGLYYGTDRHPEPNEIRLFPNPVSGNLLFVESGRDRIRSVEAYSLSGVKVLSRSPIGERSAEIDVAHLVPGIYIGCITLWDDSVVNRKFIIR